MTDRERFRRLLSYQPIDRLPVLALEPFETMAIDRWRREGLPAGADPVEYLGLSRLVYVPVSFGPSPGFEARVIAEDAESVVERTWMGATVRRSKCNPSMFYGHEDHPVKTRRDWDEYRRRFGASTPGRLPSDWPGTVARLKSTPHPVGLCLFPFFFRFCFYAMGMERFLTAFHDDPEWMHEVFAHLGRFYADAIRPVLDMIELDFVLLAEDLAGKNGPLISPRTYAEFWRPHQEPVLALCRDHRVPVVCQWSSGRFRELLPGMLEQGFNCTWPAEAMAGMDAPALRRQFGQGLRLGGNIAKEAVIAGPGAIDAEIERLLPLIREGGFLPALDDMASPDMPFAHYRYLTRKLQELRLDG